MTTEETELTFIRCPNCRSLVPAVATRCRMCGYNFESAPDQASTQSADPSKAKSRVRQRTISASTGEVVDDFSPRTEEPAALATEAPPPFAGYGQSIDVQPQNASSPPAFEIDQFETPEDTESPFSAHDDEPSSEDDIRNQFEVHVADEAPADDAPAETAGIESRHEFHSETLKGIPSSFMEDDVELQIRGDVLASSARSNWEDEQQLPDPMSRELPEEEEDELFDAGMSFEADAADPSAEKSESQAFAAASTAHEHEDEDEEGSDEDEDDSGQAASSGAAGPEAPAGKRRRRRRRKKRGTGLHHVGQAAEGDGPQQVASQPVHAQPEAESKPSSKPEPMQFRAAKPEPVRAPEPAKAPEPFKAAEQSKDAEPKFDAPKSEEAKPDNRPDFQLRENRAEPRESQPTASVASEISTKQGGTNMSTAEAARPRTNGSASPVNNAAVLQERDFGMLVGWMVTYGSDPKGSSIEIRGGRFFIGGQRLREHDIVIADRGLSAPHCLVAAIPGGGLRVQDLMSEGGTFIKRQGASTFERVNDVVVVEHGDALRFGDYEVRICLMP